MFILTIHWVSDMYKYPSLVWEIQQKKGRPENIVEILR